VGSKKKRPSHRRTRHAGEGEGDSVESDILRADQKRDRVLQQGKTPQKLVRSSPWGGGGGGRTGDFDRGDNTCQTYFPDAQSCGKKKERKKRFGVVFYSGWFKDRAGKSCTVGNTEKKEALKLFVVQSRGEGERKKAFNHPTRGIEIKRKWWNSFM